MNDPILYLGVLMGIAIVSIVSIWLQKVKRKYLLIVPAAAMAIALPVFIFVMIAGNTPLAKPLFYISMSLWTGGMVSFIINSFVYRQKR